MCSQRTTLCSRLIYDRDLMGGSKTLSSILERGVVIVSYSDDCL